MSVNLHPTLAVHPGEWLRTEIVAARDLSVEDAAQMLAVPIATLDALLSCRVALSPELASRVERVFGVSAETMLNMQRHSDRAQTGAGAGD